MEFNSNFDLLENKLNGRDNIFFRTMKGVSGIIVKINGRIYVDVTTKRGDEVKFYAHENGNFESEAHDKNSNSIDVPFELSELINDIR